jgi:hypothetical protein
VGHTYIQPIAPSPGRVLDEGGGGKGSDNSGDAVNGLLGHDFSIREYTCIEK